METWAYIPTDSKLLMTEAVRQFIGHMMGFPNELTYNIRNPRPFLLSYHDIETFFSPLYIV